MRRAFVIGAGAAGLVSLRHLASRPDDFEAVAYEQMSTLVFSENQESGMFY